MGILKIDSPIKIIEEAINKIDNPSAFNFSEYVNTIEKLAHEIYLEKEKEAIKNLILKKYGKSTPLIKIIDNLVVLIQQLSTVIANTRRARGGISSEIILCKALKTYSKIDCEVIGRKRSNKSYYPDIAIPSYASLVKFPTKSIALAVKRTLRERWREDIAIFKHYPNSGFVCLSNTTDITEGKLRDMDMEGIKTLFIPDEIYIRHKIFIQHHIKNMKVFNLSFLPIWIKSKLKV